MVISELIQRMEDIKARYGDCRVFILSKSFYEGGTIIDAQDILLTSFNTDDKSAEKEVIAMISNCPVVGAVPGTEEDAERILGKAAIKEDKSTELLPRLFISVEDVLLAIFVETGKYYVDHWMIDRFSNYIRAKISAGHFKKYEGVTRDLDMDACIRLSGAVPHMFDIAGERIYLRVDWDELIDYVNEIQPDDTVHDLVCEFLKWEKENPNQDAAQVVFVSHNCTKCSTTADVTVNFNLDDTDTEKAIEDHPDWKQLLDSGGVKLGTVTCPKCGLTNYIIVY